MITAVTVIHVLQGTALTIYYKNTHSFLLVYCSAKLLILENDAKSSNMVSTKASGVFSAELREGC